MNQITTQEIGQIENVLINGDLAKLSENDRVFYYNKVCESVGLNPLTRPFEYITLNNKLTLYAKRDCADQLRQLHGVSIKVIERGEVDGQYEVHVAAQDKHGRTDEDIGAVPIGGLRGEARSNAIAKAMTKAKRRVTLSICGLGLLDETEASDVIGTKDISYNLDEIFPDEKKPEALTAPPVDESEVADTKTHPEKDVSPDASTGPIKTSTGPIKTSTLEYIPSQGKEIKYLYDNESFAKEYKLEVNALEADYKVQPRDRMTNMKQFKELNQERLDKLPPSWVKKLEKARLDANKRLGAGK